MTPPVTRDVLLCLFAWEVGSVTFEVACAALGLTHDELFDLETREAEQGAALARQRATPANDAGKRAA